MTLRLLLEAVVLTALLEDLGRAGDITSIATVPQENKEAALALGGVVALRVGRHRMAELVQA